MALKLGFVLFLIYGFAHLLRRYGQPGGGGYEKENTFSKLYTRIFGGLRPDISRAALAKQAKEHEAIRILQVKPIRPQLQLQLIEVENQRFLLSVSNEGASLLYTFPVKEISDETSP
jgi:flagellar biogenesis protein FliO